MKSKKLKIEVVNRYFYPVSGGIETVLAQTFAYADKLNWDVRFHVSKNTLDKRNYLESREKVKGFNVRRYTMTKFGFFPEVNWKSSDVITLQNFDIFPHFFLLLYVLYLKILRKKNFIFVLIPHGGFNPDWTTFPKIKGFIKKTYHYTIGTLLINLAVDGIQAVSEWEKIALDSKGINPELITVIENGIEKEAFFNLDKKAGIEIRKRAKEYGKYLIQIGRIHPIKNYETTIKALVKLPQDINFVIVGPDEDGIYKEGLVRLVSKLNLEKRVFFAGVIRGIDKYYLINKSLMMVHMATWENNSISITEGISQGKICITSDTYGNPFLVKNGINGFNLPPKNHLKLAKIINFILQNKEDKPLQHIRDNNLALGLTKSWSKVAKRFDFYLRTLLNKHATSVSGINKDVSYLVPVTEKKYGIDLCYRIYYNAIRFMQRSRKTTTL